MATTSGLAWACGELVPVGRCSVWAACSSEAWCSSITVAADWAACLTGGSDPRAISPSSHTHLRQRRLFADDLRGYGAKVNLYRAVGAVTAIYGAGLVIVPEILTRPAGIAQRGSQTWIRVVLRAIGVRDVAVGLAMTQARSREAVVSLGAVRIAADLGDAVFFGWALPASNAIKVGGPAGGWAALSAVATARSAARTPSYVMRQPGGTPAAQATGSHGPASGTDVRQGDDRD